ncbi:unnamed protein product [Ilex paraguariensis]|uniref:Uncharacterized protein n=1 Tax=Ilex paraguariensis TaxID=185542 RepID=A0ABC8TBM9_9AQUA
MSARGPLQLFPMTPDLGQAGCSALEDAVILGRHIGETVIRDGRLVPKEAANVIERLLSHRVFDVSKYDCGKLPTISSGYGEYECPRKDETNQVV